MFKNLPKDLIDAASGIMKESSNNRSKSYRKLVKEALKAFKVKSITQLSESEQHLFATWVANRLDEACGCGYSEESDDELLHKKAAVDAQSGLPELGEEDEKELDEEEDEELSEEDEEDKLEESDDSDEDDLKEEDEEDKLEEEEDDERIDGPASAKKNAPLPGAALSSLTAGDDSDELKDKDELEEEEEDKDLNESFKVGDVVYVKTGPLKNYPHKIIYDNKNGSYNVVAPGAPNRLNYRQGAASAKASELSSKLIKEDYCSPEPLAAIGARSGLENPKHVDIIKDIDVVSGINTYRLLINYVNGRPEIIPSVDLPGAPSVEALADLVSGFEDVDGVINQAIADALDVPSERPVYRGNDKT